MQVFKAFLQVLKHKLSTAFVYIIVFFVIAIPMTINGNKERIFEATKLAVCVFDADDTPESHALTDFIGQQHDLVTVENDRTAITDALYYEAVDYVLVIEDGYAEKLENGETDALFSSYRMHDSYGAALVQQMLDRYISTVQAYRTGGAELTDAIADAADVLTEKTEVRYAETKNTAVLSPVNASYFTYMSYILISVIFSVLSPVLLTMNRKDLRFRTACSCLRPNARTMQIFAGSSLFVLVIWALFTVTGILLGGGQISGLAWLVIPNSLLYAIICTGIAIFVAELGVRTQVINMLTQILGLGMSFLCGVFVEQSMLGEGVLAVGRFLPAYWYVRLIDMLRGAIPYDAGEAAMCLLIETGFAFVMMILSLLVHKQFVRAKTNMN